MRLICHAYDLTGHVCGRPAAAIDHARGCAVCAEHAASLPHTRSNKTDRAVLAAQAAAEREKNRAEGVQPDPPPAWPHAVAEKKPRGYYRGAEKKEGLVVVHYEDPTPIWLAALAGFAGGLIATGLMIITLAEVGLL